MLLFPLLFLISRDIGGEFAKKSMCIDKCHLPQIQLKLKDEYVSKINFIEKDNRNTKKGLRLLTFKNNIFYVFYPLECKENIQKKSTKVFLVPRDSIIAVSIEK